MSRPPSSGFGLLLVAGQLRRGKRRAWHVAVALSAAAAAAAWLRGPDPLVVLAAAAMLVALVWHRAGVHGTSRPGRRCSTSRDSSPGSWRSRWLRRRRRHGRRRRVESRGGRCSALGLSGVGGRVPARLRGRLRTDRARSAQARERAARARGAPTAAGTLDYFALRPDKSWFFSAAGDAMIAYAYLGGYALAAADPIGPPGSHERVVAEFLAHLPRARVARRVPRGRARPTCRSTGGTACAASTSATRRSCAATASRSPAAP